jgi:hypothetical protein
MSPKQYLKSLRLPHGAASALITSTVSFQNPVWVSAFTGKSMDEDGSGPVLTN